MNYTIRRDDGAAQTLKRRIDSRNRYRVRRDSKIATDLIGRHFEHRFTSDLGTVSLTLRLSSYNSVTHTITLYPVSREDVGQVVWDTDRFWSMRRTGEVIDA